MNSNQLNSQQQPDANQLASQAAYNQVFGQKAVDRFGQTSVELFHALAQLEIKDQIIAALQQQIGELQREIAESKSAKIDEFKKV